MQKLVIILIFSFILGIIGCAGSGNTSKISGTLYVAGNEPFTYLALDTKDRTIYKIECTDSLKKELWQLQGKLVSLGYNKIEKFDKVNILTTISYELVEVDN
ncbi:MAG: hypothetical protein V3W20_13940 [Candidatus Neomarinimicrobiota bacterium]